MKYMRIIHEFENYSSISEISEKYGLPVKVVKTILKNRLPPSTYLHISHVIGARIANNRLRDPVYREKYSKKMKRSVSLSIRKKMKKQDFLDKWKEKAKHGSELGNKKILTLMSDPSFYSSWRLKCCAGGAALVACKKGIFDASFFNSRRIWSQIGLKHTSRKRIGPLGEHMYNDLEVKVAKTLMRCGSRYSYERLFSNDSLNGFFSVDFIVDDLHLAIEVTYWDKVHEKSCKLVRKFSHLSSLLPGYRFIVITKAELSDKYKKSMPCNILVLTTIELEQMIVGSNSKYSGVTDSRI